MTVTVSVDATRRLARFSVEPYWTPSGKVFANDEILVQEPATPTKGAEEVFTGNTPTTSEEGQVTYGTMYGAAVERDIGAVIDQTVTVGGVTISFETLIAASGAFFEMWRQEDIANPPVLTGSTDSPPPE
jgi:hypothetical protein